MAIPSGSGSGNADLLKLLKSALIRVKAEVVNTEEQAVPATVTADDLAAPTAALRGRRWTFIMSGVVSVLATGAAILLAFLANNLAMEANALAQQANAFAEEANARDELTIRFGGRLDPCPVINTETGELETFSGQRIILSNAGRQPIILAGVDDGIDGPEWVAWLPLEDSRCKVRFDEPIRMEVGAAVTMFVLTPGDTVHYPPLLTKSDGTVIEPTLLVDDDVPTPDIAAAVLDRLPTACDAVLPAAG